MLSREPGDESPRTFLLGVGAQKAGTSWLHRQLAGSAQCDPGFRKEYHVFDVVDLGAPAPVGDVRLTVFRADPEAYADYFTDLLGRAGVRLSTDITPSYAGLSVPRLRAIRALFESRGVRAVSLFLLRDPVERIWSSVRMGVLRDPQRYSRTAEDQVRAVYASPFHESRTRYDRTLAALDEAFEPTRTFVACYERLFEPATLARLSGFLGIDPVSPDIERRVNASPKQAQLPQQTQRLIAQHYREAYLAVAARFGEDEVRAVWPSSRYVDL